MTTRTRVEHGLVGTALGAFGVVFVVGILAAGLTASAGPSVPSPSGFQAWLADVGGSPAAAARWLLADTTEPQFFKSELAAVGLFAGAGVAWAFRRRRWAGTSISYGSRLWPWVLVSAGLSLILSNLAFAWALPGGWLPTFVPFVCAAPAIVLKYGRGWAVALTGAVVGFATTAPLAVALFVWVARPLDLPSVLTSVTAMSAGTALAFLAVRWLPWMRLHEPQPVDGEAERIPVGLRPSVRSDAAWAARRVLQDWTEPQFYANELASLGIIAGVSVAFYLDPSGPSYGSGLLPQILAAQALTSAVGVTVWRRWYRDGGWAPTYVSLASVAPAAVVAFDGSLFGIVGGAVLGALLAPPVARYAAGRLPADFHPVIANTFSMLVATSAVLLMLAAANELWR